MTSEKVIRFAAGPLLAFTLVAGSLNARAQAPAQAAAPAAESHAKGDLSGDWQGTLQTPQRALRTILRVTKADKGWAAKFYSIDQGGTPISVTAITSDGVTVKYTIDLIGGNYEGKLSPDGNSIVGTWSQGNAIPLTLVRATKETAWEIPAPPPPLKLMPADADPTFEVATIKPNDSGATSMQGLTVNGRNFATRASSLLDLISFAYEVQSKQVVGGPDWLDKDRYDIAAVPDIDGAPNPAQVRSMIRKLLTERFKLTFHKEKRDMSAYVLTVSKSGQKLTPTELKGPLPGIGFRPMPGGLMLNMRNGTLSDLTGFLQILVLDRPVVDRTELKDKYDLVVKFTPDETQFHGHPPKLPASSSSGATAGTGPSGTATVDTTESFPDLFQAFQQQLGLKLDAEKTAVDVIAIDKVEKPSAN
ncbi:MAG TPA: TIGR03435 family protein [Edaphobacter sp.]|jgi:uncharacterized protein (TIGR03435 family)|nr:TIGR03435 family protein [Edaphobacter sp.]